METMVFTQLTPPKAQSEDLDLRDLKILDKTSLTSVVDFMHKFAEDKNFTPPTRDVMFDTDRFKLSIDDKGDFPNLYDDIESLGENK